MTPGFSKNIIIRRHNDIMLSTCVSHGKRLTHVYSRSKVKVTMGTLLPGTNLPEWPYPQQTWVQTQGLIMTTGCSMYACLNLELKLRQ